MKTFHCSCGNTLYFENTFCLSCRREVGWCPVCKGIHSMDADGPDGYICTNPDCRASLVKCFNYAFHKVCNRMIAGEPEDAEKEHLCNYCRFNETIPDLSVPGNQEKWYRLEVAKRRLLYNLDLLHLPYGTQAEGFELPLSFDFKADVLPGSDEVWKTMGQEERVYTGHADGKITINIREADPVAREKLRIDFGESHRTLIGHFRHEIGHYYWQLLIQGTCEATFKALYGDHENPTYSQALEQYYRQGAPPDWQQSYISAYATMHPWEDFAETWGAYLDMVSVLDTAENASLLQIEGEEKQDSQFDAMLERYQQIGIKVNEVNRELGLVDLVPEVYSPSVVRKMRFIHHLVKKAGKTRLQMH
jgi:hypothetical protein